MVGAVGFIDHNMSILTLILWKKPIFLNQGHLALASFQIVIYHAVMHQCFIFVGHVALILEPESACAWIPRNWNPGDMHMHQRSSPWLVEIGWCSMSARYINTSCDIFNGVPGEPNFMQILSKYPIFLCIWNVICKVMAAKSGKLQFLKPLWWWNRNISGKLGLWHIYSHYSFRPEVLSIRGIDHGPLTRYVKLLVTPGMPGTFSPPLQVSDPDQIHKM